MIKHDIKDGFKWRKYGQKNIKSASFPRSYYRCTKPDCPARKQVENGLAKYENQHNHEKPSLLLLSQQKNKSQQQKDIIGTPNKVEKKKSKGRPPGSISSLGGVGGCYKKIKAPKAARKFYHDDDDDDGGNDGGNDRPPPHPLVAALRALSPKLARREEENNEKREDGNTNENNNNRDDSSKKRSDGEMAAAIFSMEEAPLSPGYWDKAEGSYFDDTGNPHGGGGENIKTQARFGTTAVTGSATKKQQRPKNIEVSTNHGYFGGGGGGGSGGITGFLTSPRLTGIVSNVFTGAKDFCEFRQMLSPDECNEGKKKKKKEKKQVGGTNAAQPFESDNERNDDEGEEGEDEEENETKKVEDPGPLVYQQSPKCARKKERFSSAAMEEEEDVDVVNIDATPEKFGKKDFKAIAKSRRGLLPFIEEQGMLLDKDESGSALSREETVLHAFSKREVHNNPLQSPKGAKTSFKDAKKANKILSCSTASGGKISKKKSKKSKLTSSEALAAETYCEAILKGMRHEEASAIAAQKVREMNEKTQRLKELARERKKARSLVPPSMPPQQGSGALGKNNSFSRLYEADVYDNSKTNSYQVSPAVSDHGEGQQPAANIAVAPALNNSNVDTYTAHDTNNNNANGDNKTTNGGGGGGGGLWSPIWQMEKAVSQFCSSYFPNLGEDDLNLPDPLGDFEALSPPRQKENGGGHASGGSRMIWWTR
ncbi:unnamed protein product [Bathycoccus prasinos]